MGNPGLSRAWRITLAALALFLFWQVALSANSIGPPARFWFTLEYEISGRPALDGAQIIGCSKEDCAEPELLAQFGRCDGAGCMSMPVEGGWDTKFECAENLCRFATRSWEGGYLRLVVQFSDRNRLSPPVGPLTFQYGMEMAWRVEVGQSGLTPIEQPDFSAPATNYSLFGAALALTELVELLIAAGFVYLVLKDGSRIRNVLTAVCLINLITVPVVWYTFPSWGRFQDGTARGMGLVVLVLFAVYALFLVGIFRSEGKRRRTLAILTILSLFVAFAAVLISLFLTSYGNYDIALQGLSPVMVVVLSEAFAFAAEAVLLTAMARNSLSGWQAVLLSFVANSASFLAGLWIIGSR